ncbi:MAG: hypothetical protein GYB68_05300 [Chloroflexi bacterium]|nr:hypothetical protein [Chloroflexota bacterium]
MPRQGGSGSRRWLPVLIGALLLVGTIIVGLLSFQANLIVTEIQAARDLDSGFRPVEPTDQFTPAESFAVSVRLQNYRTGDQIVARWRYGAEVIEQTALLADGIGAGYAGFRLDNANPWPLGRYSVEIVQVFANGEERQLGVTSFEVVGE